MKNIVTNKENRSDKLRVGEIGVRFNIVRVLCCNNVKRLYKSFENQFKIGEGCIGHVA